MKLRVMISVHWGLSVSSVVSPKYVNKVERVCEDGIGGGGPSEGAAVAVVVPNELVNARNEFANAAEAAATDSLLSDESKPAFDLVDPGRIGGCVVDMQARPLPEPGAHFGVLVGGVVIHDQMHIQTGRD